jgi:serine/threonine protein kinase
METCPFCAATLNDTPSHCPNCGADLRSPHLERGTLIDARYRIETVLGQGGFGITYLATDTRTNARVAIKELFPDGSARQELHVSPPSHLNFAETKHKFLEEASVVQRFRHPNIVQVFHTLEENGTAYIVMEALEGETLTMRIIERGVFPSAEAMTLVRQLCEALEVVHASGLLHRDIKPDNVFLTKETRVVLIDFGSARAFAQGQVKKHTRLVTPGYAAPEQYATEATFGTYTDVYGLAATLYFALEGNMPPNALDRLNDDAPLELHRAPFLEAAIRAGLAINTKERTQTPRLFLEAFLAGDAETTKNEIDEDRVIYTNHGLSITDKELILPDSRFEFSEIKGFRVQESDPLNQNSGGAHSWQYPLMVFGFAGFSISIILFFVGMVAPFFSFLQLFGVLLFFLSIGALFFDHLVTQNTVPASYSARVIVITNPSPSRNALQIELLNTVSPFETQRLEQALDQVLPRLT